MPIIAIKFLAAGGGILLAGAGVKLVGDGIEDTADGATKFALSAGFLLGAYLVAKKTGVLK